MLSWKTENNLIVYSDTSVSSSYNSQNFQSEAFVTFNRNVYKLNSHNILLAPKIFADQDVNDWWHWVGDLSTWDYSANDTPSV